MLSIHHTFLYLALAGSLSGLAGCNQGSDKKAETASKPVSMKDSIPDLTTITDDNVREVLTEFGKHNPETVVLISTPMGNIKVKLYQETPLHRANFILMAKSKFLDEG